MRFDAGIATLLNRINKPCRTVAVDGSLYRYHPHFHDLMMRKIEQLVPPALVVSVCSRTTSARGKCVLSYSACFFKHDISILVGCASISMIFNDSYIAGLIKNYVHYNYVSTALLCTNQNYIQRSYTNMSLFIN